jgi:hypothetical protein
MGVALPQLPKPLEKPTDAPPPVNYHACHPSFLCAHVISASVICCRLFRSATHFDLAGGISEALIIDTVNVDVQVYCPRKAVTNSQLCCLVRSDAVAYGSL